MLENPADLGYRSHELMRAGLSMFDSDSVSRRPANAFMDPGSVAFVRARAPLRLGLAGGGTDVSPYCDEHGGAVLNVTIDMYAYTIIEPASDGRVVMTAADIGQVVEATADEIMDVADPLILHKAVYRRIVQQFNGGRPLSCRITTFCDAPPGSGLGTSSTVVVSLVKCFAEWLGLPLGEYEIAHLAYEIERTDANLAGGRQDQYAASFGGVNFIEFYRDDRVIVNPLRVKNWIMSELETSLVLFNSGVSRSSAAIIQRQTANLTDERSHALAAMHELKRDAIGMKECLLKGDSDPVRGLHAEVMDREEAVGGRDQQRPDRRRLRAGDGGGVRWRARSPAPAAAVS